jgi:predicted phage tail protein
MLKVICYGIYKDHLPKGAKRGLDLHASSVAEAFAALELVMPFKRLGNQHKVELRVGETLKKSRKLTVSEARTCKLCGRDGNQNTTLHVLPSSDGAEPVSLSAIIVGSLITSAVSIGVTLLVDLLFPPQTNKADNRKSALFSGSMNTQQQGVPVPYIAGVNTWCGGNVIEANISNASSNGNTTLFTPGAGATGDNVAVIGGIYGSGVFSSEAENGNLSDIISVNPNTTSGAGIGGGGHQIANNQFSDATLSFLMATGSGPIQGITGTTQAQKENNIYIAQNNNSWVQLRDSGSGQYNFDGFIWTERVGVPGQTPVSLTPGTSAPFTSDIQLTHSNEDGTVADPITQTVSNALADYVQIQIEFILVDTDSSGNQHNTNVQIQANRKRLSDTTWEEFASWNVSGKQSSGFAQSFQVNAPPAKPNGETWMFQVQRITADSTNDNLVNTTTFLGWNEVENLKLPYDGSGGEVPTSLFGVSLDMSQFNQDTTPQIALVMAGRQCRIPANYDPVARTYATTGPGTTGGVWDGTYNRAATDNPVWHWLELATDVENGAGIPDSFFNKFSMYQISQYNDQQVGSPPYTRFTLNYQFTDSTDCWTLLQNLAQTFRAFCYWNGSQVLLVQDAPQSAPDHYINNSMAAGGMFTYTETDMTTRVNQVTAQYDNVQNFYQLNQITYQDNTSIAANAAVGLPMGGIISGTIYKTGCQNSQEAFDWARAQVFIALNEWETVTWNTPMIGAAYAPGQIVEIDDWNLTGKQPVGRVLAAPNANQFQVDQPITLLANQSYVLRSVATSTFNGGPQSTATFTPLPVVDSDTTSDIINLPNHGLVAGTPVGFVQNGGVQPRQYRIISIVEQSTGVFQVQAKFNDPGKYAFIDNGTPAPVIPWTQINTSLPPAVTGLQAIPFSAANDLTGVAHSIEISWNAINVPGLALAGYTLNAVLPGNTATSQLYSGSSTSFTMTNAQPGVYVFQVIATNLMGGSSTPTFTEFDFEPGSDQTSTTLQPPVLLGVS